MYLEIRFSNGSVPYIHVNLHDFVGHKVLSYMRCRLCLKEAVCLKNKKSIITHLELNIILYPNQVIQIESTSGVIYFLVQLYNPD